MQMIETEWWTMGLPEEWDAQVDDDTVLVSDMDGIGVIELSAVKKEGGTVGADDLQPFCTDLEEAGYRASTARLGPFRGRLYEYREDEQWCRDWIVASGDLVLLVSYTCLAEDRGLDDAAVEEMLDTLEPLAPPQPA